MSQWIGIWNTVWATLSSTWLTMVQSARFLSHKTSLFLGPAYPSLDIQLSGPESYLLQELKLKSLHIKFSPKG